MTIRTAHIVGQRAIPVTVLANYENGLPTVDITGLQEASARELRVRVRGALTNSGVSFPLGRITMAFVSPTQVNGTNVDLAAAVALLFELGYLGKNVTLVADKLFFAELSLSGELRPCRGALPAALAAKSLGLDIVVAVDNAREAALAGITVIAPRTLNDLIEHIQVKTTCEFHGSVAPEAALRTPGPDFSDVFGQPAAVRAMTVAAAGGHNILLIGGPGAGKTMLARRLSTVLPPLTHDESLQVTTIHSVAGLTIGGGLVTARPFRAPHHSTTPAGLIGGGVPARPGELTLAHNGVLMLDELPEFNRQTLEYLREPTETRRVDLSRAAGTITYDADTLVVGAMNPCPCGMKGNPRRSCRCTKTSIDGYDARVSPILGIFDIRVTLPPIDFAIEADDHGPRVSSASLQAQVIAARERQNARGMLNARRETNQLSGMSLSQEARKLLEHAIEHNGLTGKDYDRMRRVSQTIADLDGADVIDALHVAEALTYVGPHAGQAGHTFEHAPRLS